MPVLRYGANAREELQRCGTDMPQLRRIVAYDERRERRTVYQCPPAGL